MRIKIELYILSIAILFGLLFINKITFPICFDENCEYIGTWELIKNNWIPVICILGLLYGICIYYRFKYLIIDSGKIGPWKIVSIENISFENLSFLATFIIPLLCFDLDFNLDEGRNAIMLLLVLLSIGAIYIKANLYYTNPSLALAGFHIYKITYSFQKKTFTCMVLSRDKLKEGDEIFSKLIDEKIYYSRIKTTKDDEK